MKKQIIYNGTAAAFLGINKTDASKELEEIYSYKPTLPDVIANLSDEQWQELEKARNEIREKRIIPATREKKIINKPTIKQ